MSRPKRPEVSKLGASPGWIETVSPTSANTIRLDSG